MKPRKHYLRVLASGSSGNAVFFRSGGARVLIDAGVSYRRLETGLAEIGEHPSRLDAVLVTHEHGDHVRGLPRLAKLHPGLEIFASRGTASALERHFDASVPVEAIEAETGMSIARMRVRPFPISHDAAEAFGYRLEVGRFAFASATDLGVPSQAVRTALQDCQVLVLEANHDPEMLSRGAYPAFLKRRVASRRGHLSNEQARGLLQEVAGPHLDTVILGHISAENNTSEAALEAVAPALGAFPMVKLSVASRRHAGPLMVFRDPPRKRTARPISQARQQALPF